jgi:hypothetical protein
MCQEREKGTRILTNNTSADKEFFVAEEIEVVGRLVNVKAVRVDEKD